MVNYQFAKFKDTPLNRDGETMDPDATLPLTEGDTIGLTTNADDETIVVPADADSASPQPMIGVLMENVYDRSHWSVNLHDNGTMGRELDDAYAKNQTQAGDEVTYFTHGIYVEDEDEEQTFTPNEPVYLGVGGGFTQSKPSTTGDIQQVVGVAVTQNRFLLDVDFDYTTSA
jgi:hypothetical protein